MNPSQEVAIVVTGPDQTSFLTPSRRNTADSNEISLSARRSSTMLTINHTPRRHSSQIAAHKLMMELIQVAAGINDSTKSLNQMSAIKENDPAFQNLKKNRRAGYDQLSIALSALYAKLIVVLGIAFPVTDILSLRAPPSFYQGFYLLLYSISVGFVLFMYAAHLKTRAVFTLIDSYEERHGDHIGFKKRIVRYGSFYLRVGSIAFGIGSMVYSGLEFGQYFELKEDDACQNILIALNPCARMLLSMVQMQFIFLNTKQFEMTRHKAVVRFGLMHLIATNLCEWLYVLVEETKHEIIHILNHDTLFQETESNLTVHHHHLTKRATALEIVVECRRTNIMGTLVQNAAPFLFPCTIEYSLICAVILFEMWKKIKTEDPWASKRPSKENFVQQKDIHQLSVDCSKAHRGMFSGILVIVMTIISLIMYFVLKDEPSYKSKAVLEVEISELILYTLTTIAVLAAMYNMRDLKFSKKTTSGVGLDCTLLLLAQGGIYIYCMFSIMACYFSMEDDDSPDTNMYGLYSEMFSLIQTSIQTLFILNSWWRRAKGNSQKRQKPGRELITFLLIANMAIWFINTLIKNRASFRVTHLNFFGVWAWTIITHVSMPLAIFYRFHSTICLFEIWKSAYKLGNVRH